MKIKHARFYVKKQKEAFWLFSLYIYIFIYSKNECMPIYLKKKKKHNILFK